MGPEGNVAETGYLVKVRGDYFAAAAGNRKIIARYELEVKLPTMDRALSIIKNKLLDPLLKRKYPDYINYRTHEMVSFKALGSAGDPKHLPLHLQGREQLIEHIEKKKLAIDPIIYPELTGLRKAIALCETDPKKYVQVAKADKSEFLENKALADLNPALKEKGSVPAKEEKPKEQGDAPPPAASPPPPAGPGVAEHESGLDL